MPVLSVDLAIRNWSDLGLVYLEHRGPQIACDVISLTQSPDITIASPPPVVELAVRLNTLCLERGAAVLMLDGPQSYRSDEHSSASTLLASHNLDLDSPTGPRIAHDRFVGYCLALYEALSRLGWQRLASPNRRPNPASSPDTTPEGTRDSSPRRKILVESYPSAAWKSLGLAPLPDRLSCRVSHLAEAWASLTAILPLTTNRPPNRNQMQALVGGLPGLAIASDLEGEQIAQATEKRIWEPAIPSRPENDPARNSRAVTSTAVTSPAVTSPAVTSSASTSPAREPHSPSSVLPRSRA